MDNITVKTDTLDQRVAAARQSNEAIERLIQEFQPLIRARAAKYSMEQDANRREELFSVAVTAFYESVRSYAMEKGHFLPFANRVISKRIIDHLRSIYKHEGKTISLEEEEGGPGPSVQSAAFENISLRMYETQRRQELLAEEIELFKQELGTWGITMEALSRKSPKHKTLRDTYKSAVYIISQTPEIVRTIREKHYFPIQAISKITKLPLKKLEHARTYLLAALILKTGDYDLLSGYVEDGR